MTNDRDELFSRCAVLTADLIDRDNEIASLTDALAVMESRALAAESTLARVRAIVDNPKDRHYPILAREDIRAAWKSHNAHLLANDELPRHRMDLVTWGNAYEVAERKVRNALNPPPKRGD